MQKHNFSHDDAYLKKIPKSDYYKVRSANTIFISCQCNLAVSLYLVNVTFSFKNLQCYFFLQIVQLMDEKKKEGGLRTQSEVDTFWRQIRKPEVFSKYFPPSLSGKISSFSFQVTFITCISYNNHFCHKTLVNN